MLFIINSRRFIDSMDLFWLIIDKSDETTKRMINFGEAQVQPSGSSQHRPRPCEASGSIFFDALLVLKKPTGTRAKIKKWFTGTSTMTCYYYFFLFFSGRFCSMFLDDYCKACAARPCKQWLRTWWASWHRIQKTRDNELLLMSTKNIYIYILLQYYMWYYLYFLDISCTSLYICSLVV